MQSYQFDKLLPVTVLGLIVMKQTPVVIVSWDVLGPTRVPLYNPAAITVYDSRQSSPGITIVAFPSIVSELSG